MNLLKYQICNRCREYRGNRLWFQVDTESWNAAHDGIRNRVVWSPLYDEVRGLAQAEVMRLNIGMYEIDQTSHKLSRS